MGIDNINDYYEKSLKFKRLDNIKQASKSSKSKFTFYEISLEDEELLNEVFNKTPATSKSLNSVNKL